MSRSLQSLLAPLLDLFGNVKGLPFSRIPNKASFMVAHLWLFMVLHPVFINIAIIVARPLQSWVCLLIAALPSPLTNTSTQHLVSFTRSGGQQMENSHSLMKILSSQKAHNEFIPRTPHANCLTRNANRLLILKDTSAEHLTLCHFSTRPFWTRSSSYGRKSALHPISHARLSANLGCMAQPSMD